MPEYHAPLQDMLFLLESVFSVDSLLSRFDAFQGMDILLLKSMLEAGNTFCQQELLPLNQSGDAQGCLFHNGEVKTPKGFPEAYQAFVDYGFASVTANPDFGGQGLPKMLGILLEEMYCACNVSFSLYPSLTAGAAGALQTHATPELQATYLPKLISGQWTGTMCLTESHSGTDLGMMRTKATLQPDGTYRINGSKIFITAGEHDLAENILHLVLARADDSKPGTKALGLFLVPKFLPTETNALGPTNGVTCGAIEHKMGIKASSTCVINFDNAKGFVVGNASEGMKNMFTLMNTERLAIGIQGIGLADMAYQNAAAYAKTRLQGRAPEGAINPQGPADPIIVHPDIRRMLLTIRAYVEGSRAFALWIAQQLDIAQHTQQAEEKTHAQALITFLTPIAKAFFTDIGTEATNLGVQILGGHGYITEWGMEQLVRDARIAQIYEGTNGVQAMDLTGRKLVQDQGKMAKVFAQVLQRFVEKHPAENMQAFIIPLKHTLSVFENNSQWIIAASQTHKATIGAAANDYLRLAALTCLAYLWAQMAEAALDKPEKFYQQKRITARFFMEKLLPQVDSLSQQIQAGSNVVMSLKNEDF